MSREFSVFDASGQKVNAEGMRDFEPIDNPDSAQMLAERFAYALSNNDRYFDAQQHLSKDDLIAAAQLQIPADVFFWGNRIDDRAIRLAASIAIKQAIGENADVLMDILRQLTRQDIRATHDAPLMLQ